MAVTQVIDLVGAFVGVYDFPGATANWVTVASDDFTDSVTAAALAASQKFVEVQYRNLSQNTHYLSLAERAAGASIIDQIICPPDSLTVVKMRGLNDPSTSIKWVKKIAFKVANVADLGQIVAVFDQTA